MVEAPACGTCRWWDGRISGRVYDPGPCRRYPPTVFYNTERPAQQKAWPITDIKDFCGEHTPKDKP